MQHEHVHESKLVAVIALLFASCISIMYVLAFPANTNVDLTCLLFTFRIPKLVSRNNMD